MFTKSTSALTRLSLALALGVALAACSPTDKASDGDTDQKETSGQMSSNEGIQESARKLFGGATPAPEDITESPIEGLMQVKMNGNLFYASPDGKYFMQGDMIEVDTMQSMTRAALEDGRPERIAEIDPEALGAITYEAKNEKFEVYVFTDVTCPYCTQFHEGMKEYNKAGITVHYFAWPRSGPNSEAASDMSSAWCAKDQKGALDDLFDRKSIDEAECDSPVESHLELGYSLNVNGTPAVFSPDGRQHGGYMPPADLLRSLEGKPQGE